MSTIHGLFAIVFAIVILMFFAMMGAGM